MRGPIQKYQKNSWFSIKREEQQGNIIILRDWLTTRETPCKFFYTFKIRDNQIIILISTKMKNHNFNLDQNENKNIPILTMGTPISNLPDCF